MILGGYVTILSLLRNLAVNDSQNDLNNATLFEQPGFAEQYQYFDDNFTEFANNFTVIVSNAVLWVCRRGSSNGDFYRTIYTMAITFIIIFHFFTGFSRFFTQKFYYVYKKEEDDDGKVIRSSKPKDMDTIIKTMLSAVFLNFALLMLLLSFDISPWSCLNKPSEISVQYFPVTNRFSLHIDHSPSAIRFQQGASITSAVLIAVWVIVHVVFYLYDYGGICDRANDIGMHELQIVNENKHDDDDDN